MIWLLYCTVCKKKEGGAVKETRPDFDREREREGGGGGSDALHTIMRWPSGVVEDWLVLRNLRLIKAW